MSRATLSKDDIKTMGDVRRDIWTSGFQGLFVGSLGGYVLHGLARTAHNRLSDASKLKIFGPGDVPIRFTRNSTWLCVMAGGAISSFAMASAAGKNRVHKLHQVYEVGKKPTGTEYQRGLARARDREEELQERVRRRMSRRATVRHRLEEGHGLSDSHGGHWIEQREGMEDVDEMGLSKAAIYRRQSRRAMRKQMLEDAHGLSSSHGGHWVKDDLEGPD